VQFGRASQRHSCSGKRSYIPDRAVSSCVVRPGQFWGVVTRYRPLLPPLAAAGLRPGRIRRLSRYLSLVSSRSMASHVSANAELVSGATLGWCGKVVLRDLDDVLGGA